MAMQREMPANAIVGNPPSGECSDALPAPTLAIPAFPLWNVLRLQSEA